MLGKLTRRSLMKHKALQLIVFSGVLLIGSLTYGQGSLRAIQKKPRTLEDYKPSTLKKISGATLNRAGLQPFRVRVEYTESVRPISSTRNDLLHHFAQCCAGDPGHYTKAYLREIEFVENGSSYWLPVHERLVPDIQAELKAGEAVDLFLIRVSVPDPGVKGDSVLLLVERFQRSGANNNQVRESVNWIRSNLPLYAEKKLKVEIPSPCRLSITDLSKTASLSKAVVFIPLADIDPMKVSVLNRQSSTAWDLWLHTTVSKPSILFMLYQGAPAEGGQASKYSLTIRDREKAEAMAEAFRRAVNLCAGVTVN